MREYFDAGVRHIVALRGDLPAGPDAPYVAHPEGYQRTEDLVAAIKRAGDFEVSVSAYPERHPQSPTLFHDVEALKRKIDAGADRAITQFFFDNSVYFRFLDVAAAAGIEIPIVPGIAPVQNFRQTANFARRAGAERARLARRAFRGSRRRSDDAPPRRRGGVRRAGARPHRPRRDAFALLYDEPRRPGVRDLPFDWVEGEGSGSQRFVGEGAVSGGFTRPRP